jgi:hypothetical protein
MQTAARQASDRIADAASPWTLSDSDALLSELGVVNAGTFAGTEDEDDALQADAGEAPSASSLTKGSEERRSEMDERIMAGLVRA